MWSLPIRFSFFSVIATLLPISIVCAETLPTDARGWLDRLSRASRQLNYDGTFVYVHGQSVDAMRLVHKSDQRGEQERLVSLNGETREVVRNNNQVTCVLPGSRQVILDKAARGISALPVPGVNDYRQIEAYYDLTLEHRERIAGRQAQAIYLQGKDPYRYAYRLWLDVDSGLLLKSELYDQQQALEQVIFTSLELRDTISDALLKPSVTVTASSLARGDANIVANAPVYWDAAWMPDGFNVKEKTHRKLSSTGKVVEHITLFDGLTLVSIFIEPSQDAFSEPHGTQKGAVNAYSLARDNVQITAVGEVPALTVKRIAESVRYTKVATAH